MWDGFNLRKFPRIPVRCHVIVCLERKKIRFSTKTRNMGLGGICVYLPKPLERMAGCKVLLKLDLRHPSLKCPGRIVWSVPTQDLKASHKKLFDTGIEFVNCPQEVLEKIGFFIARYAAEDKV